MRKMQGASALIIAVILMVAASLIILFAANYSVLEQRATRNIYSTNQAYTAAEAGMQFGMAYLNQNSATIIASASGGGVINYGSAVAALTNVALANGSKFSVIYTNPTPSNYSLMQITATGVSSDGTGTEVISQQVQQAASTNTSTAMSLGNVTIVGGSVLTNTISNMNIISGGTITMNNGASTVTSKGTVSTQGNYGSDVVQNSPTLQGLSESQFFTSIFGTSESSMQSQAAGSGTSYTNLAGSDYSSVLSGVAGKVIYISQTNGAAATLGHGVTIGTLANPVIIIVEGDLTVANGVTIYGFVYSSAPSAGFNLAGGATITGGIASAGQMNISNGFKMTYTKLPSALISGSGAYSPVTGSWRDF